MKAIRKHLKIVTLFFSFTFLLQSCKVYHTKTVTVDEAILSSKRVKVNTYRNDTYKFEELRKDDGKLYGITKKKSGTAKDLSFQGYEEDDNSKYVKILLPDTIVKEVYLQNKTMSTVVSIAVPLLIIIGLAAIIQPGNVISGSFDGPLYY
ncbi:hypothetical protein [Lutibacter sp.]|uniref:hypothetical protein n=1 Tax=Lutibacter sp. TaxID=1925666 RepID=UPI0035624CD7